MSEKEAQKEQKGKKWLVFWTSGGRERRAKKSLEKVLAERGLLEHVEILLPMQVLPKIRKGKRVLLEKPIYGGYIIIGIENDEELIQKVIKEVTSTNLVKALIGKDSIVSLTEEEVRTIKDMEAKERQKKEKEIPFLEGEVVRIVNGPFADFQGKVAEIYPDKLKLKVLVDIFGRTTPVVLDFLEVEKI